MYKNKLETEYKKEKEIGFVSQKMFMFLEYCDLDKDQLPWPAFLTNG